MTTVLITAFEPYDRWTANASWQAVIELTRELPATPKITTRLYPVDFPAAKLRLSEDLQANYDYALHLGQAPGSGSLRLEAFGINVGGSGQQLPEDFEPLATDGPAAYQCSLPLARWAGMLRKAGIPAHVSHHAGTFLCNATLYLSHYYSERMGLKTRSMFLHVPLSTVQAVGQRGDAASLPSILVATALRLILSDLVSGEVV